MPLNPVSSDVPSELTPLISVIMPAYNVGRFIGAAIQSVLAQTYPHWELLIVDDASADNTGEVVRAFRDSRIHYVSMPRVGKPSAVRNSALQRAKGELIAFLDADDRFFPDSLEKLARPLLKNPALTAVYGFAFNIDEKGNALTPSVPLIPSTSDNVLDHSTQDASNQENGERCASQESPYALPPDYSHSWENIVTSNISCLLPALMIRRSTLEAVGRFNEKLTGAEDYEFYIRLYLHNYEGVYCLSDYVYQYRVHAESLTKTPARCQQLLDSCLHIMKWLFHEAALPTEVQPYQSLAYVACYRYLARERLLARQPDLCRQIVFKAILDPHITLSDSLRQCGPLFIRSLLPAFLNDWLVAYRQKKRARHTPVPKQRPILRVLESVEIGERGESVDADDRGEIAS